MLKKIVNLIKDPKLIEVAFTHRSYLNEHPKQNLVSNERLEFLGDSVLSFIVSDNLYNNYQHLPEGDLTNLRSLLVQAKTLASISVELNFGSLLKLSRGEDESGGRKNTTILANTYEAFLGALFLDGGLKVAERFVNETLLTKLSDISEKGNYKDDKSLLQEYVQEKKLPAPVYKVLKSEGPDHAKLFTVGVYIADKLTTQGQGRSKSEAEKDAAKKALSEWINK